MLALLGRLQRLLAGGRFAVFGIALLTAYLALLIAMLAMPVGEDALGRFAEEFKTWCFGYDPATGAMEPVMIAMLLGEPAGLALVVTAIWWGPIREALARPRTLAGPVVAALSIVLAGAAAAGALAEGPETGELPFPADRLRTAHEPPPVALVDHTGAPLSLEALRGKVVMVTGVYASCSQACPMILAQAKRSLEALSPEAREDVVVVAVTLDPSRDTPEVLSKLAAAQGVAAPAWRLASGDPASVERTLDAFGFSRSRDPETGVIDHASLFLVLDRGGKIAYRFTLGERQERWLESALELLAAEGAARS